MTKKKNEQRHIQNRTWEKERRERLNVTFEQLAKLLPEYQPKVNFSKIEILQKSIDYIENLRSKLKDLLCTQNPSILKTQEQLEDSVKALLQQNNDLVALLEKANIKVPLFVAPKVLSFIVTVHGAKKAKHDENAESSDDNSSSERCADKCNNQTDDKNDSNKDKTSPNTNACTVPEQVTEKIQSLHILPDEGETKKFGSVDVISVTNANQFELKPHEQPVKNSVEITPLIAKTEAIEPKSQETQTQEPSSEANAATVPKIASTITTGNTSKKMVKNVDVSSPSKEPILVLETNIPPCKIDLHKTNEIPVHTDDVTYNLNVPECPTQAVDRSSENKLLPNSDSKPAESDPKQKPISSRLLPKLSLEYLLSSKSTIEPAMKELALPHADNVVDNTTPNDHEKDLDDELFESFRLPQTPNASNPNALSPTAAFLLSFPVVSTTSCAKPTETDNSFTSSANLLRLDEKTSQPKDHSLLESITAFDFGFNDLNDVGDGKNIANHVMNEEGQYTYGLGKSRPIDIADDGNKSKKRSFETIDKHIDSSESNKNEKNIQILSDTKLPIAEFRKSYSSEYLSATTTHDYPYTKQYTTLTKPTDAMTSLPATESFYSSLSSLGLPMKPTMPTTTTAAPPTTSHFNFQISSLTQSRPNMVESRPTLLTDPPQFTFSLTRPTQTTHVSTKTQPSIDSTSLTAGRSVNKTTKAKTSTKHSVSERLVGPSESAVPSLARCTTYNPFAFDNPSVLSTSSSLTLSNLMTTPSSTMTTMNSTFSFTLTPSFTSMPTTTSMLSNPEPMFSSTFDMPLLGTSSSISKPVSNRKEKSTGHGHTIKDSITSAKSVRNTATVVTSSNPKPIKNHVNWMTSPVPKSTQDLDLSTNLFNAATEETSTWSTNRLIDSNSLNSFSTLPQLQGDLSLNTITSNFGIGNSSGSSNTITTTTTTASTTNNSMNSYRNDTGTENKRHYAGKTFSPQKAGASKTHRKSDPFQLPKYGKSEKAINSFHNYPASMANTSTVRSNTDGGQTVNNFHSVSQLVDTHDRQNHKSDVFFMGDDKIHTKESMKQKLPDKLSSMSACNIGLNDYMPNDFDKDLGISNYLFNPTKRLKLNYAPGSDAYLPTNQNVNNYDIAATNDIHATYGNYQSYETDCTTSSGPCINNFANQTFPYQYGQSQSYHQQQQFHAPSAPPPPPPPPPSASVLPPPMPQNTCDTLEPIITQNYFQAPAPPLPSYKSTGLNDFSRTTHTKSITNQPTYTTLHASPSKSNYNATDSKTLSSMAVHVGQNTNHSIQSLNKSSNRGIVTPSKVNSAPIYLPPPPPPPPTSSHTAPSASNNFNNINNIALNQPWNDSFSWMPYSNHTYNSQLFGNENNGPKANHSTANTTTIPNFNLTTIFPDCNKS